MGGVKVVRVSEEPDAVAVDADQRVAVVIPAYNEAPVVAATVRACRAIPAVDLVVVVDDGSTDKTQNAARGAGAVVVRHSVNRGKASAMETGIKVVAMRDVPGLPERHILVMDAWLGDSAAECTPAVAAVLEGRADCAIAISTRAPALGRAEVSARLGLARLTGFVSEQPLSPHRCLTRRAASAAMPFSNGSGLEPGMTADVLLAGLSVLEVVCDVPTIRRAGRVLPITRLRDVLAAMWARRLFRTRVPAGVRARAQAMAATNKPYRLEGVNRTGS